MPLYILEGRSPVLAPGAWVAPSADLIGDVRLGDGASVWFGAVIRGDNTPIVVGARSNIQDGAVLHSDLGYKLNVGEGVTVGHRAILHGCTIGDGALIGMGATVLNGARVGAGCLVGAGALVTEGLSFRPGRLILGAPAKDVRPLTDEEATRLRASATGYAARARAYADGLRAVG